MWPFNWNLFSSTFTWYYLFSMYLWVCRWNPMVWPFKWTCPAVLSHVTIYLVCSSNSWVWMKSYGLTTQIVPFLFCNTWKCVLLEFRFVDTYERKPFKITRVEYQVPSAYRHRNLSKCYRFWFANELTKSGFFAVTVTFDWPIYAWAAPLEFVALESYLPLFFPLAPFRLIVLL